MRFCNISNRPWLRRICLFTSFLGWVWPLAVAGLIFSCSFLCCARKASCTARGSAPALTGLLFRSELSGVLIRCSRTVTGRGRGRRPAWRSASFWGWGRWGVWRCVANFQAMGRNFFCTVSNLQLKRMEWSANNLIGAVVWLWQRRRHAILADKNKICGHKLGR